jgi:hypothetical protein
MNQRAIELYKQALEHAYSKIGKEHAKTEFFHGVVAGKFAELIVQEYSNFLITNELVGPAVVVMAHKHFGVKE